MAGCRKAADRLMPHLGALLKGPQWEGQMFKAIADELKQAGVYPKHPPLPEPECADAVRGEAGSTSSSTGSIGAGLGAAAEAVAVMPVIGTVLVAALVLIAAVIIMIGQIIAKALEEQAAAKEKQAAPKEKEKQAAAKETEEQDAKVKKLRKRVADEMERRDDCVLFGKKPD